MELFYKHGLFYVVLVLICFILMFICIYVGRKLLKIPIEDSHEDMKKLQSTTENKKCGYCGCILSSKVDPLQHSCFSDYDANVDVLLMDENNVVTIGNKTCDEMGEINMSEIDLMQETQGMEATQDEVLIACVAQKPALYDYRLPLNERTMMKKNALWNEVCNIMGGIMDVDTIKKRWKYLKDCYMKDRKKTNEYVASGSASTSKRKSTFRFSQAMSFLSDCIEPRPTSSTLPINEGEPPIRIQSASPQSCASNQSASPYSPSSANVYSTSNCSNSSKRKRLDSTKNDKDHLEESFIAAIMNEPTGKMDSVDHFALRLADGLRKLPYRERAKLEIEFLSRILEVQERLNIE